MGTAPLDAEAIERELYRCISTAGAVFKSGGTWDAGASSAYAPIAAGLDLLLVQGHADAVVRLGETLLDSGLAQAARVHDDGATAADVAACLELVFTALERSSLTVGNPPQAAGLPTRAVRRVSRRLEPLPMAS